MNRKIKTIPSSKPYFTKADREKISFEINNILSGGRLTQGPWVEKFENSFAEYIGVQYAVATNSGTSALEILLRYFKIKNTEVIVPTNTFLSTANAVIFAGGRPVLSDISKDFLCLNLENIREKITQKTSGVIAVHIAGLVCPQIDKIREYCKEKKLFLIEDAAHAAGASKHNIKAGALTDGGAFSFYPTKTLTTGEGGMITTNDPDCANFAQSLRCHGIVIGKDLNGKNKNHLTRLGYNWRMSEIQAMIGYYQLLRLDEMIDKRTEIASLYQTQLRNIDEVEIFSLPAGFRHSFYKYPILIDKKINPVDLKKIMAKEFGISCGSIYYPPCHLQPFYKKEYGSSEGDFPIAEETLYQTIALPVFPELKAEDIQRIINALKKSIRKLKETNPER